MMGTDKIEEQVLNRGDRLLKQLKVRDPANEYLTDGGDQPLDFWMRILRRVPLPHQLGESDLDYYKRMADEDDRKHAAAVRAAPFLHAKMGTKDPTAPIPFTDDDGNQQEIIVVGVRPAQQWTPAPTGSTPPVLPNNP